MVLVKHANHLGKKINLHFLYQDEFAMDHRFRGKNKITKELKE